MAVESGPPGRSGDEWTQPFPQIRTPPKKPVQADVLGPVIGIDFGMSESYVGVYKDGRVEVISNGANGQSRVTPSIVTFKHTLSGTHQSPYSIQQLNNADGSESDAQDHQDSITIFDIQRLLGRSMDDPQVQEYVQTLPYRVVNRNGLPAIEVRENETYSSEEIISMIIRRLKENAEVYLNENVTHAVLTVPAYYSDAQRSAMRDAGALAGLNVIRVQDEPAAASIGYGLDRRSDERNVLVYDLGESSLSITVMIIAESSHEILATTSDRLELLATGHPPFRDRPSPIWRPLMPAGGKAFDQCLLVYLMRVINNKYETGGRIEDQPRVTTRLLQEAEKAKRLLSTMDEVHIQLDTLLETVHDSNIMLHVNETITRTKFEEECHDLFRAMLAPIPQILQQAEMNAREIQDILLIGSGSHLPKLRQSLLALFPGRVIHHDAAVRPEEAVVTGASLIGHILSGAPGLPCCGPFEFTKLSLGIATIDGVMTTLIERNSMEPCRKVYKFSTSQDNQTSVRIQVYQGERALVKDNRFLGEFELKGLTPTRRGVPRIEIVIEIDPNGILTLAAEEKSTGLMERLTISHDRRHELDYEEIDRMVMDGYETFAESDHFIRLRMANRNALENYALTIRNHMAEDLTTGTDVSNGSINEQEKLSCHKAISKALVMIDRDRTRVCNVLENISPFFVDEVDRPSTAPVPSFADELQSLKKTCQPIMTHFSASLFSMSSVDDSRCTYPKEIDGFANNPYSSILALRFLPS